jgi:putative FmdB family regulatory protein
MPTYEYRCPKGHEFEQFQRMSEPPVAQCPACGQEATRLLSGGAGLLFKGDGFYITDYRSDSYRKAAESDKPDSKGGEPAKSGSGKGEGSGKGGDSGKGEGSGTAGRGKSDAGSSSGSGGSGPAPGKDAG